MRDSPYTSGQPSANIYEHPCAPLMKILSSGTFYHATYPHWDLSTRLTERLKRGKSIGHDLGAFDERFIWNEYVVRSLLDFRDRLDPLERLELDRCEFIVCALLHSNILSTPKLPNQTLAIQGYVGIFTVPLPAPPQAGSPAIGTLAMISRLGWKRAGTRFNTRGVDDDGNTANFVEVGNL